MRGVFGLWLLGAAGVAGLPACTDAGRGSASGADVADGAADDAMPGTGGSGSGPTGCDHGLTDFVGDCYALEPPAPSEGFQLHYGPSEYDGAELARYLLEPGKEVVDCLYMTTPNDQEIFYQRHELASRHGTHHVIVWADVDAQPDGTLAPCPTSPGLGARWTMWMDGALGVDGAKKAFPTGTVAPEDQGLAYRFGPHTTIGYQAHFVNAGEEPILRESWANVYYMPRSDVATVVDTIAFIGGLGMNILPNTTDKTPATCSLPPGETELRVLNFHGHMHSHGQRFSVWKVDAAGIRTRVYETFDWAEPGLMQYSPGLTNPVPDAGTKRAGGSSGLLTLKQGERFDYECEFVNDETFSLRWANEAYTAEMCNLIGMYSPSNGSPWGCQNF